MIEYHSIQNILDLCKEQDKKIWEVVLQADMDESGASGEQVFEKMRFMYRAMQEADQSYEANLKSQSGMVGGDGEKMRQYNATRKNLCSEYSSLAMEKALKMGESNACMKRIVAAPTAGSCGVIPAVLLSYEENKNAEEDELVKALFVASGIGKLWPKMLRLPEHLVGVRQKSEQQVLWRQVHLLTCKEQIMNRLCRQRPSP